MTTITFEWNSADVAVWRNRKIDASIARALRLAGNQGIRTVQKESGVHITTRKRIRVEDVKKGLSLSLPLRSKHIEDFVWTMTASGAPVPLGKFKHVDTRRAGQGVRARGVLVEVNVGRVGRLASGFTARMRSSHEGVFMRRGKSRLPIDELYTTRVSDPLRDPGVVPSVESKGYRKLEAAFQRGLAREIAKLKRKGLA